MNSKLLFLLLLILIYILGCEVNALFEPDDSSEPREPGARERRPADNNNGPETTSAKLYLPLQEGANWTYQVAYIQISKTSASYSVTYRGEEKWTCSLARYSDSTFVLQTFFTGEKILSNQGSVSVESIQDAYAYVAAKIINGALTIVREEGDLICPFLGDWLSQMQNRFRVCLQSNDQQMTREINEADFSCAYTLDGEKGMTGGIVSKKSDYDSLKIEYILE